jgi:murein DD-endopeptidase MepM/ murein hydrolase activator NlpD
MWSKIYICCVDTMVSTGLASRIKKSVFISMFSILPFFPTTSLHDFLYFNYLRKTLFENRYPLKHDHISPDQTITVRSGETFVNIISSLGINRDLIYPLAHSIESRLRVKTLQTNKRIRFIVLDENSNKVIVGRIPKSIELHIDDVILKGIFCKNTVSYSFVEEKQRILEKIRLVEGKVGGNLYKSILRAGATDRIAGEYTRILKSKIDVKKDLEENTVFQILFKISETTAGFVLEEGDILYASLSNGKKKYNLYNFKESSCNNYYDEYGALIDRELFITPIPGARITSRYGYRIHPISHKKKLHRGIDLSAKKGTAIKAAATGKIIKKSIDKGYGKYLIIKHNSVYSTLYAHMYNFHPTANLGRNIKRGEVIGYVGSTGLSTAPHLHYEIREFNVPINPDKISTGIVAILKGKSLSDFNNHKDKIKIMLDGRTLNRFTARKQHNLEKK